MNDFLYFEIITEDANDALGLCSVPILINSNHIVSIKPIRIICKNEVTNGYWVRTSNGKKYRAISAPASITTALMNAHTNSQMIETIDINNSEYLEQSVQ